MRVEQVAAETDAESILADIVDEITQRLNAGESVTHEEYAAKYPQFAETLAHLLEALTLVRQPGVTANSVLRGSPDPAGGADQLDFPPPPCGEGLGEGAGLLGDFRIIREIGRGGMGVVYEAEQISIGRRVALKVLPFAAMLDRQQLNRFKNEARAAGTLDHPNIVAIHSVGCERGVHYYAMQLIEGQSLAEVVAAQRHAAGDCPNFAKSSKQNGTVPLSQAADTVPIAHLPTLQAPSSLLSAHDFHAIAQLGIQAAEALDHAHNSGILHRDIKPANLLIECTPLHAISHRPTPSPLRAASNTPTPSPLRGGSGRGSEDPSHLKLWITDFGLARIEEDAGMTMTGDLLGTLRYMSPEQALGNRAVVDHRSDIYSLGVTLYELLTLQPAFTGDDRQELLRQIAFEEPRKARQINARIPQDLETIVLKSIEKNPADRYAIAQELADDLRRFLDDRPIAARQPGRVKRAVKWVRRHKLATALMSVVLFSAAAIGILASVAAVAEESAREAKYKSLIAEGMQHLYSRVPDYDRSIEAFTRALEFRPNSAEAYLHRGASHIRNGHYEDAIDDLRKCITIQPDDNLAAHSLMAVALSGDRQFQQADKYRNHVKQQDLGNIQVLLSQAVALEKDPQSIDYMNQVIDREPFDPWNHYYRGHLIVEIFERHELNPLNRKPLYDKAIEDLEAARKALPDDSRIFGRLCRALREQWTFMQNTDVNAALLARQRLGHLLDLSSAHLLDDFDLHWQRSMLLYDRGNAAAACVDMRKAMALRPDWEQGYRISARLHKELGRYDMEIEDLTQLIRLVPTEPDFCGERAHAHWMLGQHALVINDLKEGIRVASFEPVNHQSRATLYRMLAQVDPSAGAMEKAISDASEASRHVQAKRDSAPASRFAASAEIYYESGQSDRALTELNKAIELNSNEAALWAKRAEIHCRLGQLGRALSDQTRANTLEPRSPQFWIARAQMYIQSDQLQLALADSAQALKLMPYSAAILAKRAAIFHRLGQHDRALTELERFQQIQPDSPLLFAMRARVYYDSGQRERALAELDRSSDNAWWANYQRGLWCADSGDVHQAIEAFSKALRAAPTRVEIWVNRAKMHYRVGKLHSAIKDIDWALSLSPPYSHPYTDWRKFDDDVLNQLSPTVALKQIYADAHDVRRRCQYSLAQHPLEINDFAAATARVPEN